MAREIHKDCEVYVVYVNSSASAPITTASLEAWLQQSQYIFLTSLPPIWSEDHRIELLPNSSPSSKNPYCLSKKMEELEILLGGGFSRLSNSRYAAPILFVKKKDNSARMCVNYHTRLLYSTSWQWRTSFPCHGLITFWIAWMGPWYFPNSIWRVDTIRAKYTNDLQLHDADECSSLSLVEVCVFFNDILVFSKDPALHALHVQRLC